MLSLYVPQLSASIDEVFHSLDADGNGSLDLEELKAGFAAMVSSLHSHPPLTLPHYPYSLHF